MARVVSTSEARINLSQILSEAGFAGKETVIERNRRPIAVVIGYQEYEKLRALPCKSALWPVSRPCQSADLQGPWCRSRHEELQRRTSEREDRFAVYDEIRARNQAATMEDVTADVALAVSAVRSATA